MNEKTLNEAISEANRFVKRAKELQAALKEAPYVFSSTIESVAFRRASKDLSQALSNLRRYGD